jgi:hypothetical protein
MLKPYATLLRTPGALKFSIAGFIGRMPIAMDSLAIIFIVVAATDSYALAGALTAVGSIVVGAAEVFWSRQADRRGQAKILLLAVPTRVLFDFRSSRFKGCSNLDVVCLFNYC